MKLYLSFFYISILLLSCKKNNKNSITIDVNLESLNSSTQVEAHLYVEYQKNDDHHISYSQLEVGWTENGKYSNKIDIPSNAHVGRVVMAYGPQFYEQYYFHVGDHVIINEKLEVFYQTNLQLKNINCYDQTDSVWIKYAVNDTTPYIFKGCIDTSFNAHIVTFNPLTLYIKSKKNGVINTFTQTYNLTYTPHLIPNYLTVEY